MKPTIGRTVLYVLSEQNAIEINRRRTTGVAIAERIPEGKWPIGAQAHIGNPANAGDIVPLTVVRVWSEFSPHCVNGQATLDGNDSLWVCSASESAEKAPGTWHWPVRE